MQVSGQRQIVDSDDFSERRRTARDRLCPDESIVSKRFRTQDGPRAAPGLPRARQAILEAPALSVSLIHANSPSVLGRKMRPAGGFAAVKFPVPPNRRNGDSQPWFGGARDASILGVATTFGLDRSPSPQSDLMKTLPARKPVADTVSGGDGRDWRNC